MRVECGSIEEFQDELATEAKEGRVYKQTVRVRVDRNPEQKEAVTFCVVFHASALVGDPGEANELLHYDGMAGHDNARGTFGTTTAMRWRSEIEEICKQHELIMRPGKYELV